MLLNGNPPRQRKRKPKPRFKVIWMGSQNLNHNFEKYFFKEDEAVKYADELDGALVLEHKKAKENSMMWEIIPTESSKELLKNIAIVRKIKERYSSADGNAEVMSTTSLEERQRRRLAKALLVSPFLVYTGATYKLPNPIRIGLVACGVLLGLNELKYYLINRKLQKAKV